MAHGYGIYHKWDLYPPVALMAIGYIFAILVGVVNAVKYCLWHIGLRKDPDAKFNPFCSGLVYGLPALLLKDIFKENENKDEIQNGEKYTVKKRKVSRSVMYFFFMLVVSIFECVAISFWEIFLIDESFTCDPSLDCFPLNVSNSQPITQDPIVNCSDYEDVNNVTIICYQFALNYSGAVSAAGGILAFASLTVRVVIAALFWIVDYKPSGVWSILSHRIVSWVVISLLVFLQLIYYGILVTILLVPFLNDIIFRTDQNRLKFAAYFFVATFSSGGATLIVSKLLNEERKNRSSEHTSLSNDLHPSYGTNGVQND